MYTVPSLVDHDSLHRLPQIYSRPHVIKRMSNRNVQGNFYIHILYFAWEDQSDAAYCIFHTVLNSCITALHKLYRTVMHTQNSYPNTHINDITSTHIHTTPKAHLNKFQKQSLYLFYFFLSLP